MDEMSLTADPVATLETGSRHHGTVPDWVVRWGRVLAPDEIVVCDGSREQHASLCERLVAAGTFIPLNEALRPNSFLARSDPNDVARVEDRTFVSTRREVDAGPSNNWRDPDILRPAMLNRFRGAMRGRTMYVVPFSMGPVGAPGSLIGVQITDSAYVAVTMGVMTRVGSSVLTELGDGGFIACVHSVGVPLTDGTDDVAWPCNPVETAIAHFPEVREVWSYGSGYGGNALLGKKSLALRIASAMACTDGDWLAEHMATVAVTSPTGERHFIAAALPSGCGKTDFAMMAPTLGGWTVEVVGDDISWIRRGRDGRLYSVNPEAGFFGLAAGVCASVSPSAAETVSANCIFTNVALTDDGDVWWEGMDGETPTHLIDWQGHDWTPQTGTPAAQPNARFAAPAHQCPTLAPEWDSPGGVPLTAILVGGRRPSTMPLVVESRSWEHGVFFGSTLSSETTHAATGPTGVLRNDPFAMSAFCGYNIADYFAHWLYVGARTEARQLPRVFSINWFRTDADGELLWPGFGENIRVLKWVLERCEGAASAVDTPIGAVPTRASLDLEGLDMTTERVSALLDVDAEEWNTELQRIENYFRTIGDRLPSELVEQLDATAKRFAD